MIPYVNDGNNEKEIEEVDINELYNYEKKTQYDWYDQILLNKPLKVVIVTLLLAVAAPLLIYNFVFLSSREQHPTDGSHGSCVVPRASRLPCGLGNVSQQECHPQCCYDLNNHVCFHRYPSRFSYITEREWSEDVILQPRVATVPFSFQDSLPSIKLSIDEHSHSHVSLQFYNAQEQSHKGRRIEYKDYSYNVSTSEVTVTVNAAQGLIFSTIRGPLIASRDIWEIAFKLTNETMYGLGELPLVAGTVKMIYRHRGDFSTIPLIFAKVNDSYHGLLIESEAPTEVFVHEENQIVLRSITNAGLKLHLFVGPKPSDVMTDAIKIIGANEQLEYWMLGAHICSESSKTSKEALTDLHDFLNVAGSENLPFDSHCGAAPIVFETECERDNTIIEEAAVIVKSAGKRYVPQVSPYIRYHVENETAGEIEMNRTENACVGIISEHIEYMLHSPYHHDFIPDLYVGSVGEHTFVYPMFNNASEEFMKGLWAYEVEPDGIILENNWPLDESLINNETSLFLPYFSKNFEKAFEYTPKWNSTLLNDTTKYFYNHNIYGNHFVSAFKNVLHTGIPVWSSSQWMNGQLNINRQSVHASWTNLRKELVQAALGGISGHWLWSVPVCGDTDSFDPETQTNLCVKWYMAATYMPLIKIHSPTVPTHPLAFTGTNKNLMFGALNRRLSLLPYFFTTLQSGPLLRPMFYQFPSAEYLKDLNTQYSVGDALVIVPDLLPSQTHVHFWMPPGEWYELWGGMKIEGEAGDVVTLTTTDADFLTLIQGGAVLVMQKDAKITAEETRLHSDFYLTIALDCQTNQTTVDNHGTIASNCLANGYLYLTKQLSLIFEANDKQLKIKSSGGGFDVMCGENLKIAHTIKDINIYGLKEEHNNFDYYRQVTAGINLCDLKNTANSEIVYTFLN